jgi:hypothetical protein
MGTMSSMVLDSATAPVEGVEPVHAVTYLPTSPEDGDLETGAVLLDGRRIGLLRHRRRAGPVRPFRSPPEPDSVWYAEAIGWLPDVTRPWDTRITSSAPTRRRAAEDLLRAYRNQG